MYDIFFENTHRNFMSQPKKSMDRSMSLMTLLKLTTAKFSVGDYAFSLCKVM